MFKMDDIIHKFTMKFNDVYGIIKNDSNINVIPGDIVLYNGNAISVFYNESSWSYTMLGHINLDLSELKLLLNKSNVTFRLELK